jgi:aldose 1-epimerase
LERILINGDDESSSAFTVHESNLGSFRVINVSRRDGSMTARIAVLGATLIQWRVNIGNNLIDLIDGYAIAAELGGQDGVRSGVMIPFTNRIEKISYNFDGASYTFNPRGHPEEPTTVLHGLLRDRAFELRDIDFERDQVTIVFANEDLRSGTFDGYPFDIDVEVAMTFSTSGLTMIITGTNVGEDTAPYSSGWHPYFQLGDCVIDSLELEVPANARILTDETLIPLPGSAAFEPLRGPVDPFDFRAGKQIGALSIDTCFVALIPEEDGMIHTRLANPALGAVLDIWQERGNIHVYTSDHLSRGARKSIALEPVEAITNAFNRDDEYSVVRLVSGERRSFRFGVSLGAKPI